MLSVSVIIPNYNRADLIGETIENMLSQTLKPHQVIVVDDGSTDSSVEVIKRFGSSVLLIEQENKGPGAARNAGLKRADGTYIQFMDSDDIASQNKLEVQAKLLEEKKADIVYGPWAKAWLNGNKVKLQDVILQQGKLPGNRSPLYWFLTGWSMVFQQCLVRKSILDRVGGYLEDMHTMEDGELFVRILLSGGKLVYESETITLYRLGNDQKLTTSGSGASEKARDKIKFYRRIFKLIQEKKDDAGSVDHLMVQAHLWAALEDYYKAGFDHEQDELHELEKRLKFPASIYKYMKWLTDKKGGLKSRVIGHRWHSAYKAGKIQMAQKALINDMKKKLV